MASFPADLAAWDQDANPYYLEVYGETEPIIGAPVTQGVRAGASPAPTGLSRRVYEYRWTLGHGGQAPGHRHLGTGRTAPSLWRRLNDPAAHVYLYFPIEGGWRMEEVVATVKYLSPVRDQMTWSEKAAEGWQRVQPLLGDAGTVAATLAPFPGVGSVATGASTLLSTMARLNVGSVPQGVKGFEWYTSKVTFGPDSTHGVMQGVCWTLPRTMFELLGGRLTGTLAVSFFEIGRQDTHPAQGQYQPLPLMAHAVVRAKKREVWAPAKNQFVKLQIAPKRMGASGG